MEAYRSPACPRFHLLHPARASCQTQVVQPEDRQVDLRHRHQCPRARAAVRRPRPTRPRRTALPPTTTAIEPHQTASSPAPRTAMTTQSDPDETTTSPVMMITGQLRRVARLVLERTVRRATRSRSRPADRREIDINRAGA